MILQLQHPTPTIYPQTIHPQNLEILFIVSRFPDHVIILFMLLRACESTATDYIEVIIVN